MSVTPRPMFDDERERPDRRRWSQLPFGSEGPATTFFEAGSATGGSASLAAGADEFSDGGAVATSAPPNQRRRRPDFTFLSSCSSNAETLATPPLCGCGRVGIPM